MAASLRPSGVPVEFLEPCVGTGSFFSAARSVFGEVRLAVGVEKDPEFADAARSTWAGSGLRVIHADFTRLEPPDRRFNLILTNPPYVRHHHLSFDDKTRLRLDVGRSTGISLSGLSGLYCYFLLAAHDWLADGGLAAWLIPGEFLDVNYGSGVKEYLTTRVDLLRIHRFAASDVRFDDALVTSSVVVFRREPPSDRPVVFSQGGDLIRPDTAIEVDRLDLAPRSKWGRLFASVEGDRPTSGPRFGDLFRIKRGVATGCNDFFIMPESRARALGIPGAFLRPILPSPRSLPADLVESRADGFPDDPDPNVLIDCRLDPVEVSARHPALWSYYETGLTRGVHEGYLTSRRTPWYSQEDRPPAPFLCTYMGRPKSNGGAPLRFVRNRSRATAPNVYLLLYPIGPLRALLDREPALEGAVFDALRTLDPRAMADGGRVYGGGLHKVEPKELANIPADFLDRALGGRLRAEAIFRPPGA